MSDNERTTWNAQRALELADEMEVMCPPVADMLRAAVVKFAADDVATTLLIAERDRLAAEVTFQKERAAGYEAWMETRERERDKALADLAAERAASEKLSAELQEFTDAVRHAARKQQDELRLARAKLKELGVEDV